MVSFMQYTTNTCFKFPYFNLLPTNALLIETSQSIYPSQSIQYWLNCWIVKLPHLLFKISTVQLTPTLLQNFRRSARQGYQLMEVSFLNSLVCWNNRKFKMCYWQSKVRGLRKYDETRWFYRLFRTLKSWLVFPFFSVYDENLIPSAHLFLKEAFGCFHNNLSNTSKVT